MPSQQEIVDAYFPSQLDQFFTAYGEVVIPSGETRRSSLDSLVRNAIAEKINGILEQYSLEAGQYYIHNEDSRKMYLREVKDSREGIRHLTSGFVATSGFQSEITRKMLQQRLSGPQKKVNEAA